MRCALLLVALTVIAAALVHLRRGEVRARYETHRCQARQVTLQRRLWNQQVQLSELTSPRQIRERAEAMALRLTERTYLTTRGGPGQTIAQRPRRPWRRMMTHRGD